MKKKSFLLLTTLSLSLTFIISLVCISNNNQAYFWANEQYTCSLPSEFTEISEVIEYAKEHSGEDNIYKFRGTVTRVTDNEAYVQRKNQLSLECDAIKITGFSSFGYSLKVGNVVDISGGKLYFANKHAYLELTNDDQLYVSYDENPTGYGPKKYESYNELINDYRGEYYAYSQLVTLSNTAFESCSTIQISDKTYVTLKFQDLFSKKYFSCLLLFNDTQDVIDLLNSAKSNNHSLEITGILTKYKNFYGPYFIIENQNDIVDEGSFIDLDVIDNSTSTIFFYTSETGFYFNYYQLKGFDESIAYVNFSDFYFVMMSGLFMDEQYARLFEYEVPGEKDTFIFKIGYEEYEDYLYFVIDTLNDTISIVDYLYIFTINQVTDDDNVYFVNGLETQYCHITEQSEVLEDPSVMNFDLGQFDLDIVKDKYNNVYIPLTVACNILLNSINFPIAWNGEYLFYIDNLVNDETMLGYFMYYSPFSNEKTRTQEFANFTYNEYLFSMKYFYGLYYKKVPLMSSLDSIIAQMGYKEDLLSTNTELYETAMANFVACFISDGHARYFNCSPYGAEKYSDYYYLATDYTNGRNDRVNKIYDDFEEIENLKSSAGKEVGLELYGNTAIIRFDSFYKYYGSTPSGEIDLSLYTYEELHDAGTDLLFRKAFDEIEANNLDLSKTKIENVVVDIVNNGGGMVDSIPFLAAYFTSDVTLTTMNSLNGEIIRPHYSLDLNYDGVFGDTYEGEFNFYLLVSSASFSCGNEFPTLMKENGAMTLIGETSGGGECCVGAIASACGTTFRNSSIAHFGFYDDSNHKFVGNDEGITPDYAYPREKFYDSAYLVDFISQIK